MHIVYLSLGSNMGDRKHLMERAIQKIEKQIGHVVRQSAFYETEPWGFESSNLFLNAAVCVETELTPRQLLQVTQQIERALGRTQKTPKQHDPTPSPPKWRGACPPLGRLGGVSNIPIVPLTSTSYYTTTLRLTNPT